jgi:Tat protein secretion system quality control protein TatD with DNase activity
MELESSTAMGAHNGLPRVKIVGFDLREIEAIAQLDQSSEGIECYFTVGIHEAEIADLHETGWQHMLEEATDEFHDIQSHRSPSGAFGLFVTKGDDSILHTDNATIGDGNFKNIMLSFKLI